MSDNDLTVAEAAELSGYSEGHIRWLVRQERIDSKRVGQRVILVDRESLLARVQKMRELGAQKFAPQ